MAHLLFEVSDTRLEEDLDGMRKIEFWIVVLTLIHMIISHGKCRRIAGCLSWRNVAFSFIHRAVRVVLFVIGVDEDDPDAGGESKQQDRAQHYEGSSGFERIFHH